MNFMILLQILAYNVFLVVHNVQTINMIIANNVKLIEEKIKILL